MLKTLTGNNSLLLWEQNRNSINIYQHTNDTSFDDFIKNEIKNFFEQLKNIFIKSNKVSFCVEWMKFSDVFYKKLFKNLKDFLKCDDDKAERVKNKIRGNIGEIFAEKFWTKLCGDLIDINSYSPVDPHNERFLDATALSNDGVKIGIQIKNHKGEISSEVFLKASLEDNLNMREAFNVSDNEGKKYMSRKREYIFSFTDEKFSLNLDTYKSIIDFIGPKEINLKLKNNNNRIDILEQIIQEIN